MAARMTVSCASRKGRGRWEVCADSPCEEARVTIDRHCAKLRTDPENVRIVADLAELADATFVIEAIAEAQRKGRADARPGRPGVRRQ